LQALPTVPSATVRITLGLFVLALAACVLAYVALATPGKWFPGAEAKRWSADTMTLSRGRGELQGGQWIVAPGDPSGTVILAVATSLRSSDYPVVTWTASHIPDNAQVRLMWRNDYAPGRLNMSPVTVVAGHPLPVLLAQDGNWSGTITGLALAIQSPAPQPMTVSTVAAQPMGAAELLRERVGEWLGFERWSQASINTVTGGAEVQALPFIVLLVASVIVAALLWLVVSYRRRVLVMLPAVLGILFVTAWLVSDARWGWNLARQVRDTIGQFGGLGDEARHLAADDGALFAFIRDVRAKLPDRPVRIFIAADDPYFRGRGAYHLYPNNVYFYPFENTLPAPGWMHPGDYVVVYRRRGIQFDPSNGHLRWDNQEPVRAELLLAESGGALFKVL